MISGVYIVYFEGINEVYIGESSNIVNRWARHITDLKKQCHHNYKLQEAYNTYSFPMFEILVHESDKLKRSDLEISLIQEFNAYYDGFNGTTGYGVSGSGADHSKALYSREVYLKIVKELAYTDKSLGSISEDLGVSKNVVCNISLLRGHGWIEQEMPLEYELILMKFNISKPRGSDPTIEQAFLSLVQTNKSIKKIAVENNITEKTIQHIYYQTAYCWLKDKYPIEYNIMLENKSILRDKDYSIVYTINSPIGQKFTFSNQKEFAKEHKLNAGNLNLVLNGKRKSCNGGWRCNDY